MYKIYLIVFLWSAQFYAGQTALNSKHLNNNSGMFDGFPFILIVDIN